jgi:pilus assembly protein CpaC
MPLVPSRLRRRLVDAVILSVAVLLPPTRAAAQSDVKPLDLMVGRSLPITSVGSINKVSVANPDIADVVVITPKEIVINGKTAGETDILLYGPDAPRQHLRVSVRSSSERRQIQVGVKFAEVRREALQNLGVSGLYRATNGATRAGTGVLRSDDRFQGNNLVLPSSEVRFATFLSSFNTKDLLAFIDAEEQSGNARSLAEPVIMAANRENASFLAGGELPIPLVQGAGGTAGGAFVTIVWREFGVRLNFNAEVVSDSLLKIHIRPEVSSLDFANAIVLQGFRIPALRTRKVETTVDVLAGRSLIISGLFNEERESVKTGLPLLQQIPILGALFSSQRWQRNESELLVVVSPTVMDPNRPPAGDLLRFVPDTTLPAKKAIEKRLPPGKNR